MTASVGVVEADRALFGAFGTLEDPLFVVDLREALLSLVAGPRRAARETEVPTQSVN